MNEAGCWWSRSWVRHLRLRTRQAWCDDITYKCFVFLIRLTLIDFINICSVRNKSSSNMKKRFTLKRSRTKDRDEDLQEISLDILLAHKDDVICKVLYNQFAFSITTLFEFQIFCFYVNVLFQLKNEYKSFLSRKLDIEKELAEVEKHEIFLR